MLLNTYFILYIYILAHLLIHSQIFAANLIVVSDSNRNFVFSSIICLCLQLYYSGLILLLVVICRGEFLFFSSIPLLQFQLFIFAADQKTKQNKKPHRLFCSVHSFVVLCCSFLFILFSHLFLLFSP